MTMIKEYVYSHEQDQRARTRFVHRIDRHYRKNRGCFPNYSLRRMTCSRVILYSYNAPPAYNHYVIPSHFCRGIVYWATTTLPSYSNPSVLDLIIRLNHVMKPGHEGISGINIEREKCKGNSVKTTSFVQRETQ